jgi:hypothetical protein
MQIIYLKIHFSIQLINSFSAIYKNFKIINITSLHENRIHFSVILNSSVPRNIFKLYSSVPKLMKVHATDEYRPGTFIG